MKRQYSFPKGHWDWPVKLTHHHAVRAGNLVFTGGQVDLDPQGNVRHIGDLETQCRNSMAYMERLFSDLGVDFSDLVRLIVYYVGNAADEERLLALLAEIIGPDVRPVVSMINMPELCYPDMLTEIEGVAMRAPNGDRIPRQCHNLPDLPALPTAFSHVLRAGDMVFTSEMSARSADGEVLHPDDWTAQTDLMLQNLGTALESVGASAADVVKVNTFYLDSDDSSNWAETATQRASLFADPGPAATGIPLPGFPHPGLTAKMAATAICGAAAETRRYVWPEGHWNWSSKLPYKHGNQSGSVIHIGGQVALTPQAEVEHAGDMVAQTRTAMANIAKVLQDFGATLDDVVKVTTFYQGNASAEALHENLVVRSNSYTAPGPATTGIPVPALVYDGLLIEIEVIAHID